MRKCEHENKQKETEERRGFFPLGQLFAHLSLSRLPQLLVFNVTPFKIDQNKNQTRSRDKVQSPSPRFRSEEYSVYEKSEEMSYPNLWRFVGRRHAGAHLDGRQHGGRKPTKTSVTEFWYKSMNLFLEELINIKVILFLINELLRIKINDKNFE